MAPVYLRLFFFCYALINVASLPVEQEGEIARRIREICFSENHIIRALVRCNRKGASKIHSSKDFVLEQNDDISFSMNKG